MSELTLTHEQRVEMHTKRRRLHETGEVSGAAAISSALLRNEYFTGVAVVPEPEIKTPKPNAKKEAWVKYALAVSDMDSEIVNNATRTDIIGMLRANGLID